MFLIFLFSIFSMLVRGYQYGVGNQIHYLIYANYQTNPQLYSSDYLLQTHKLSPTLFPFLIALTTRIIGPQELSSLIIYFVLIFFFYLTIYKIGEALDFDKKTLWLSLFLLIYPIPIAQSSINTVETSLMPRFIGDVFLLASTYLLLKKKIRLSLLPFSIGFLFHPLTLIPYPIILGVLALNGYFRPPKIIFWLLGFSLLSLPWAFRYFLSHSQNPFLIDPLWREIITSRMSYIFALDWSWKWQMAVVLIPLFFTPIKKIHPVVSATLVVSYLLFLISITSDLLSIHLGLELQLTRNLYLVFIFLILYFTKLVTPKLKGLALPTAILIIFSASILLSLKNKLDEKQSAFYRPPGYENSALWAKSNTPVDSLFLVPPEISGFRFLSQRSAVVEHKEGGDSLYSRKLALEWYTRQQLLRDYYNLDPSQVDKLKNKFHINYMVTTAHLPYPTAYASLNWKVYNLD